MNSVKMRLGVMMLLQYAVWGFWLPVLARYLQAGVDEGGLGFSAAQVGWILGLAGSVGAVSAPFIAGQFADRYFSAEKFMAVLILLGGAIKFYTASQTEYMPWLVLSVLYSVLYMPTLSLTNSIAFANLKNPDQEFPRVRVWGTIGWIAASWIFPMVWLQTDLKFQRLPPFLAGAERVDVTHRLVDSLKFSGAVSIVYAVFCLMLPHTPPKRDAVERLAFVKALKLLTKPSLAVLVAASLAVSVIHQIYFMQTGPFFSALGVRDSDIGPAMTIAQFAEIGIIVFLGAMLRTLGFRWTIFIGTIAYFLRYAIFGTTDLPVWFIVSSQALHGLCYSCFFAAAYIYVDRMADADIKTSAQAVFGIIILGVGPVIAAPFLGILEKTFKPEGGEMNFSSLWYTLAGIGLVTAIAFAAFFRDETHPMTIPLGTAVRQMTETEGVD